MPHRHRRRVLGAPRADELADLLVAHRVELRAAHLAVGTEAAAVSSGQFRHLALRLTLRLRDVERILAENAPSGDLVQICALAAIISLEGLDLPLLARHPRKDAALDVRQVGNGKLLALGCDQTTANGEGAALTDIVVNDVLAVRLERDDGLLLRHAVEPVRRAG